MCGIFGIVSIKNPVNPNRIKQATSSLDHRGPDASGIYLSEDNKVGLGHTRLSILDLSEDANQPFYSADRRYVMVFNGEIYNYREIAKALDIQTQTTADTEVVIEAFAIEGPDFVHRLNGMFAIAIWDTVEHKLHLFRDRMGIKPLYYLHDDDQFIFASELKSIYTYLQSKSGLTISRKAFHAFMHLGYIPEPLSIYNEIKKFPAGCYATIRNLKVEIRNYWNVDNQVSTQVLADGKEAENRLHELLNSSVKKRLISDVPLGTFLSGGIDSSLVTALASQHTSGKLNTFSIGFEESKFDESKYARKVAQHLGTNHTEFILSEKEALPLFDEMISTYDEPFADSSAIPTMLVSRLARAQVKVILTGDGGDEQFLGYGAYAWADRLNHPILKNPVSQKLAAALLGMGNNKMKRASQLFKNSNAIRSHIFSQEQYLFSNSDLGGLLVDYDTKNLFFYQDIHTKSPAELQAIFDLKYYLKDDLLVKVDRASMRYGLECRVPLLDHELVEFNLNLAPDLKKRGNVSKHLLKQVLYQYVPKQLFDRPKWGFGIPLAKWLKGDLHYLIEDFLNEKVVQDLGYFHYPVVHELLKRFEKGEEYLYNRLWLMILWHRWVLENKN